MKAKAYGCFNRPEFKHVFPAQDGWWLDNTTRVAKLTSVPFRMANGQLVAVPKSIAWHTLDEREFTEVRMAMQNFLWTQQAQAALWPHLDADQRYAMVDAWSRG